MEKSNNQYEDDEFSAFFQYIQAFYLKAEKSMGECGEKYLMIGQKIIKLQSAGKGLIDSIFPAISHLEILPVENPDCTILIWDSKSSKVNFSVLISEYLSKLGEWWDHLSPRGEIKGFTNDRIKATYHLGPNILNFFDKKTNIGLYWVEDINELPYYELGSPLRTLFNWCIDSPEYQFVHAGAVSINNEGILLAGKGGSGKSSVALACLNAGMDYSSDDYCLIKTGTLNQVFSIYNTAKLVGDEDLERFPNFSDYISNKKDAIEDKLLIFINNHFPERIANKFILKAIVIPVVTKNVITSIYPISGIKALSALAPTTLFQLPGAGQSSLRIMANLVKTVPCFVLELGNQISDSSKVISELLIDLNENKK